MDMFFKKYFLPGNGISFTDVDFEFSVTMTGDRDHFVYTCDMK